MHERGSAYSSCIPFDAAKALLPPILPPGVRDDPIRYCRPPFVRTAATAIATAALPTAAAAAAAAVAAAVGVDLVHILAAVAVAVGIDMAVFSGGGGEGGDGHFTPADKLHRMCAQDRRILRPSVDAV